MKLKTLKSYHLTGNVRNFSLNFLEALKELEIKESGKEDYVHKNIA